METFKAKSDYEELREARILENQSRSSNLGLKKPLLELNSPTHKRKHCKVDRSATLLRRSARLSGEPPPSEGEKLRRCFERKRREESCDHVYGISCNFCRQRKLYNEAECRWCGDRDLDQPCIAVQLEKQSLLRTEMEKMETFKAKSDYEKLREARILENQSRLSTLGLQKILLELKSLTPKRKWCKVDRSATVLRQSARLSGESLPSEGAELRFEIKKREDSCDHVYGISCHYCRLRKLCDEAECRRCRDRDLDQPCLGKTDCSVCHSSNGIFCRSCLKIRYGEELDEVRMNKEWMCPHCIEEKGTNPYWICNRFSCLDVLEHEILNMKHPNLSEEEENGCYWKCHIERAMGFKSVADWLMDKLSKE